MFNLSLMPFGKTSFKKKDTQNNFFPPEEEKVDETSVLVLICLSITK